MPGPRRSRGRKAIENQGKTLFFSPKFSRYSRIVHLDTPATAYQSATKLLQEFNEAKTREKKVRVKRVAVLAASRAKAIMGKTDLSTLEAIEFKKIAEIYREVSKKMRL